MNTKARYKQGQIYFITDHDAIKIGFSQRPAKRMANMQTSHPKPLKLIGSIPASKFEETIIHQRFSHLRLMGEWFRIEDDLLDFIEEFEKDGVMFDPAETIDRERMRNRLSRAKWDTHREHDD